MKSLIIVKILASILTIFLIYHLFPTTANASDTGIKIIDRSEWKADDNILTFEESYNFPNRVIIIPIFLKTSTPDSAQQLKELYYYFATRSGIGDFPFHYVVTWEGDVYGGNKLGDEARITLSTTEGAILIGYIQDESSSLTVSSVSSLKDITLESVNKFAINPENIAIKTLGFKIGEKGELEEIVLKKASQEWIKDIDLLKAEISDEYSPSKIAFKADILEINIPQKPQEPTETAEINIKIKNTGDFNLYSGPTSNFFVTRDNPFDERSLFYLADEWASPSRVGLLKEGERLTIGEERECSFKIYIPLYPPEHSEEFVIVGPTGKPIKGSEFEIVIKIKSIDSTIIEITDTPIGVLNVRKTPGLGEIITRVTPGERFIAQDYQSGYYKIEANGKVGWVVNTYVQVIRQN